MFRIPNATDPLLVAAAQAMPDEVDYDVLAQGDHGEGVIDGCEVTASFGGATGSGEPGPGEDTMNVDVDAGHVVINGEVIDVAVAVVPITAAGSDGRIDLIYVDQTGSADSVDGTEAARVQEIPAVPANSVALAAVFVPAGATGIPVVNIIDKRVLLGYAPAGVVVPPANDPHVAQANAAWPSADLVVAQRVWIPVRTKLRFALWECGNQADNFDVGICHLHGTDHLDFETVVSLGSTAAPAAGNQETDLGATVLPPGDYAFAFWCDGTTFQTRIGTQTIFQVTEELLELAGQTGGIPSSGTFSVASRFITGFGFKGDF